MTGTRHRGLALAAGTLLAVGCVDRRFVVETSVPAAQTFMDGVPLGPSPADGRREYTGTYTFQAVAPGYETTTERVRFRAKWYDYPPLDLFAEVLWPFRIEDVRRVRLDLVPKQPIDQAALVANADALRARGLSLRDSVVPDTKPGTPQPPGVAPLPPVTTDRPIPGNLFPAPAVGDPGTATPLPGGPVLTPGSAPGR